MSTTDAKSKKYVVQGTRKHITDTSKAASWSNSN